MVEMEIDQPADGHGAPTWREMVLEACREREIEELPHADFEDLDEWDFLVGSLADEVLWDEDWKDSEKGKYPLQLWEESCPKDQKVDMWFPRIAVKEPRCEFTVNVPLSIHTLRISRQTRQTP